MADESQMDIEDDERSDEVFRRELRKKMREGLNDLQKNRDDITIPEKLLEKLQSMNKNFSDVVATKEAALDAETFLLLSSIGREQVEALQGELIEFDTGKYAEKLVTLMGGRRGDVEEERLDWSSLGERVLSAGIFNKPPAVSFLHGALDLDPLKQRRQHQKHERRSVGGATKPKELQNLTEEEESTTKEVQHIFNYVKRECEKRGRLHYFQFLVDPDSFPRSVENMFHFSFLIKDGRAGVITGKDGQPYIYLPSDVNEIGQSTKTDKKQFIVSLNMTDWERAKVKFGIVKAAIPPRPQ